MRKISWLILFVFVLFGVNGLLFGQNPKLLTSPTEEILIFNPGISNEKPRWSPDGKKIAFLSNRKAQLKKIYKWIRNIEGAPSSNGGPEELYVINPNGSDLKEIAKTNIFGFFCWSPDGQKIAFIGFEKENGSTSKNRVAKPTSQWGEIYIIDANGSNLQKLTDSGAEVKYSNLSWSPDGKKLAFTKTEYRNEIWILILGNNSWYKLTEAYYSAWSPDSKRLACHGSTLFVIDIYGKNRSNKDDEKSLGSTEVIGDNRIAWSPDSTKIFQMSTNRISAIVPDGTIMADISTGDSGDILSFSLSPDGKFIFFAENNNPIGNSPDNYIGKMDLTYRTHKDLGVNSENIRHLQLFPRISNLTGNSGTKDKDPWCSPDGKQIVFVRDDEIWIMDTDGSNKTQLTFEKTKAIEIAKRRQKEEMVAVEKSLQKALQEK